ncbi:MAG: 30S ribosomal protein S12 methylthiotransferase RimO [Bdellovibrio sp.]|nr:30S ribosomal protein S12 methylthiotransferase RimO [Bdellovibrio sp.]
MDPQKHSKVYFISLGCPKNLVDSEVMLGRLEKDNYVITQNPNEAEVIIINTCSFIQAAKEESIETVLEMSDYKTTGKCKLLVVTGCLSQRYWQELEKELPEVDLFVGTGLYHKITEILNQSKLKFGAEIPKRSYINQPAFIHTEKDLRIKTGSTYSAYLKISEGCNRRCSFCIIPKLRGNVRSRSIESLVAEAKTLAKGGVKELNLIAQDLTEYGMEWKYNQRLETLLPELCKSEGIEWIRLHYVYPDQFSDELIEIIAREQKIVKYLDMPIQHTNDRILNLMNRKLNKKKLFSLIEKLRNKIPDIVFRTSIIVGFPSETEENFKELCRDLEKLKLDHVGVFRYSQEEETVASKLKEQIPNTIKRKREKQLLAALKAQAFQWNQKHLNQKRSVIIEDNNSLSSFFIQARMSTQSQEIDGNVFINEISSHVNTQQLKSGNILSVKITKSIPPDFFATVI